MSFDKYNDELCIVIKRLSRNNRRLQLKVLEELTKYKHTRRPVTNKVQQKLYYKSIQHIKDNLFTDLGLQLIHYRLRQFARYFTYMWNKPCLNVKTYERLSKRYPYRSTHYLRQWSILEGA